MACRLALSGWSTVNLFGINTQIFRSSRTTGLKFILTAVVSLLATAVYLALAALLMGAVGDA